MKIKLLIASSLSFVISACNPGQPGEPQFGAAIGNDLIVKGYASALKESEFDSMPVIQQYQISNKLLSTLYKGVSADEFFDISVGFSQPKRKDASNYLRHVRTQLGITLDNSSRNELDKIINGDPDFLDVNGVSAPLKPKYYLNSSRPKQMPLARILEYPISKDMFSQWIALNLTNTILFSPAEEIDSADITDVQNLFRRLELSIKSGQSIRSIVATHQRSVENWRRFRSPEDNTREMIEIYLGLFDRDEDVPRASEACRDLYLTDEAAGYKLAYTDYPNDAPQLVLGQYVLNCNDFYDVIAAHPLLIPRVISVLVDYFFEGRSSADRLRLVESIASANPETFEQIFKAILFSKEYLLNTERPRSFEEAFLGTASRMQWDAHKDIFYGMTTGRGSTGRTELAEMGWPTMSLKLGRLSGVPLDSLSFANYHKGMREVLLLDQNRWGVPMGVKKPQSPDPEPPEPLTIGADEEEQAEYRESRDSYNADLALLSQAERALYDVELAQWDKEMTVYRRVSNLDVHALLDYLFLSAAERQATDVEKAGLVEIFDNNGYLKTIDNEKFILEKFILEWYRDDIASLVMDYISRLPELYYQKSVNAGV